MAVIDIEGVGDCGEAEVFGVEVKANDVVGGVKGEDPTAK